MTMPSPRAADGAPPTTTQTVTPTCMDAWEILKLNTEWIKHAETKASIILAGSGLIGGILYNLVIGRSRDNAVFLAVSVACAACVFVAAFAAGMALRPRLHGRQAPTSLLYYHHIARRYKKDADNYTQALTVLLDDDPPALIGAIAQQIWENAQVAQAKYWWTNVGLIALLVALMTGAAAASIAAVHLF